MASIKRSKQISTREASNAVGYGYSSILTQLLSSLDQPIYNSDGYKSAYKQMITEDETIGTGLEYLTGRVASRIGAYSHEDAKIKDLVDRCIESVRGTIVDIRRALLRDSFAFGFGVGEFTIKSENGLWLLSSVQVYDPTSIQFKMTRFQDNSFGVGSVVQKTNSAGGDVEIPAGKCLIKTYGDSTTPYGKSLLRRCYRWWSFKKAIPKLWAVALERFGMPLLHGKASTKDVQKGLTEALANANSRSYIVTDKDSMVEAISAPTGSVSTGYSEAEELCDKMIYRALFLPSLLSGGENGGSYSLGKVHLELFNATAAALAEDYIDVEIEQLWRPLIEWNFGPQEDYGEFVINDSTPSDEKKVISEMLLNLANAGVIDPEGDNAWIREILGLPEMEKGAVTPRWQLEHERETQDREPSSVKPEETL